MDSADIWDEPYKEPTEDEQSARRVTALAIALINARTPMATSRVKAEFYSELSDEAFRKAYRRDRTRLGAAGISVINSKLPTGDSAWIIDEESSFVKENVLTPEDALTLDCLLLPLASEPSFPYADDLRLALTKIDRSFVNSPTSGLSPNVHGRSKSLSLIEQCLLNRHAAHVVYVRANGTTTKRTIIPLGLFPLRQSTYLVASRLTEGNVEEPHVYNLSRMRKVREDTKKTYALPPDFNVKDFIRLPFQLGDTIYTATFAVPEARMPDVQKDVDTQGVWQESDEGHTIRLKVADEEVAVTWAIAEGVRPLSPQSLVDAWKQIIVTALEET